MSPSPSSEPTDTPSTTETDNAPESLSPTTSLQPQPSYVKLAMRNMVRKGRTSLLHFVLTSIGLIAGLVGLAYLTR